MKDITGVDDIKLFVDGFYHKVQHDDLIGPVFAEKITDWQPHLNKMYAFWNAALFGVAGFKGNPFARHAPLNIAPPHFDRWLKIFNETIDNNFEGKVASDAKGRAHTMATVFMVRLANMNGGPNTVVV